MKYIRTRRRHDDTGIALVMAMGVALIGIIVAMIVISQVIVASNDSGRDRIRTAEVHSAEAAIDTTIAILEGASPCPSPGFSPSVYGSDGQQTSVTVTIQYFDDSGPVGCAGGIPSVFPNRAIITATSTNVNPVVGLQPERTMQSEVTLTPRIVLGKDAAIFSEGTFNTNGSFSLVPSLAGDDPDIWVDSGSWVCGGGSNSVHVYGSIYMPAGSLAVNGANCRIDGNTWVQNGFTTSGTGGVEVVGRSLTVRSSGVTTNGAVGVGLDVLVGGAKGGAQPITAGGTINYGVGAAAIPNLVSVGIPEVYYVPADWQPTEDGVNFAIATATDFKNLLTGSPAVCSAVNQPNPAIKLSQAGPTVYNLLTCPDFTIRKANLELAHDTAIFAKDVTVVQSLNVTSKAGTGDHKLWIIVPFDTGSGGIRANVAGLTISPQISSFWYAPGDVDINPGGNYRGQIYGGTVTIKNGNYFQYENVGIPGVDLVAGITYQNGYQVALVYKREI